MSEEFFGEFFALFSAVLGGANLVNVLPKFSLVISLGTSSSSESSMSGGNFIGLKFLAFDSSL